MDKLIIKKTQSLQGRVEISSAKNATLPIMAATLLVDGQSSFKKLPQLQDVKTTIALLENLGAKCSGDYNSFKVDTSQINNLVAPYDLVRKMRASILVLGPLLSRFGEATVSLPGGCAIGTRPIDIHLDGLKEMGASIDLEDGYVKASCAKLKGAHIKLKFPSVGATENLVMAATLADGVTRIQNAAREPEIVDLCQFLIQRGAKIKGEGSSVIEIEGVSKLQTVNEHYQIISDRIVALTYIMAALITNSEIIVENTNYKDYEAVIELLRKSGAKFELNQNSVKVLSHQKLSPLHFETTPYPGIPTDAQAQLMALALTIEGESVIKESIFENRFMHVPELVRMGAKIKLEGNKAIIRGGTPLKAAPVMCTDLRASAALVLAGLIAEGETTINRIYHLDRGYENIEGKFQKLGVQINRVKEN